MNDFDKISYGVTGAIGLIGGGVALGLTKVKKFESNKKILKVIGVLLIGIGMIFGSLFADANLQPEDDDDIESGD
jgi:hypothetical protein